MKFLLKKIKKNNFFKASLYSVASTLIRTVSMLIIGKIIAYKLGASGMALYGQLVNFAAIVLVISGGAFNEGVIKFVSEFKDTEFIKQIISSISKIIIITSIIIGFILFLFAEDISLLILQDIEFSFVFRFFGITLILNNLNNFLISIINGYKDFKRYSQSTILYSLLNLILTAILISFFSKNGALIAVILNQAVFTIILLYIIRNQIWLKWDNFKNNISYSVLQLFAGFVTLSILTTAINPLVNILIRDEIISSISLNAAGYFEFVSRISNTAIMFFSLTVSTYYLPRISEIKNRVELLKEVKSTYKIIIPSTIFILLFIYIIKDFVILLLASPNFKAASPLFFYQLLGVFFKIIAQVLGFVLLAKAKIKEIIIIEVFLNLLYVFLTIKYINIYGLIGSAYSFAIYNFIYAIAVSLIFYKIYIYSKNNKV